MERFTGKYAPEHLEYKDPWWVVGGTLGAAVVVLILGALIIG
ncbi:hypothetical protein [Nitrospirillum sp. BR 11163]|nr:hypothetical protein [Nitrospirillum sp. BR 11163]MEA1674120.1 hypothetical protein [Nitrospirillum sp. BR 11163]